MVLKGSWGCGGLAVGGRAGANSLVVGKKAQAAITDAMFLLVIVSGLAALMFFFITGSAVQGLGEENYRTSPTAGYGVSVERIAMEFYGTDYATSALQTLLYSSVPRRATETIETTKEVDYLLAFMKEDYANDRELSGSSKALLLRDLNTVLASSLPTHDFIFFMRTLPLERMSVSHFVVMLMKQTKYDEAKGEWFSKYMLCEPGDGREHLVEERLLPAAGGVVKAQPVVLRFAVIDPVTGTKSTENDRLLTALDLWPAVEFSEEVEEVIALDDKLNCEEYQP